MILKKTSALMSPKNLQVLHWVIALDTGRNSSIGPRTKNNNVHKKKKIKNKNKHKKKKEGSIFFFHNFSPLILTWSWELIRSQYFCLKFWKVFDQSNEIKGQKNC